MTLADLELVDSFPFLARRRHPFAHAFDGIPGGVVGLALLGGAVVVGVAAAQRSERVREVERSAVTGVVDGTRTTATSAASTVKDAAREQIDARVIRPVKHKAYLYGSLAFLALTAWIVLVALLVTYVADG